MALKRSEVVAAESSFSKKPRRQQTFLDKYKEKWPFMRQGKSESHAFCEICLCDLSIGSVGRVDIKRHVCFTFSVCVVDNVCFHTMLL